MAAESEAFALGAGLIKILEPLWKILLGISAALCAPILWWKRRIEKDIAHNSTLIMTHREQFLEYQNYVERHHPDKEDIRKIEEAMSSLGEKVDDLPEKLFRMLESKRR